MTIIDASILFVLIRDNATVTPANAVITITSAFAIGSAAFALSPMFKHIYPMTTPIGIRHKDSAAIVPTMPLFRLNPDHFESANAHPLSAAIVSDNAIAAV